jgi:type I restriction enzyme S subunit
MSSVITESLGSIISISKGRKHSTTDTPSIRSKRLLGIDDLRNDSLIRYTDDMNGVEVTPNDVLIAWDGANAGTIGFGKSGYIGSTIARLRIEKPINYYTPFLGIFLQHQFDYLRQTANGATIPHINRGALESIVLPNINFNNQIRIATVLSKVEALIAQRKNQLQQLDELLKSVFFEMFGDPVRNEKGWNTLPFSQTGTFKSGGTPSKNRNDFWEGTFPWLSPKDMKVARIYNTADHISEKVFKETSLKSISPGHLLIVVRGMILAHSFPTAINMVSLSINQDIKAIETISSINVIYLQKCLDLMKRQILDLVSVAGHGTKRFDSTAIERLFIPLPPLDLQNRFAQIVEKVEGVKQQYQNSLTELEALYGSLSQRAFKGELDLSRVPLPPSEQQGIPEEPITYLEEDHNPSQAVQADLLAVPDDLRDLQSPLTRRMLIDSWFESYLKQLASGQVFELAACIERITNHIESLQQADPDLPESEIDRVERFGTADYDTLQASLFKQLEQGRIIQSYDEAQKALILRSNISGS